MHQHERKRALRTGSVLLALIYGSEILTSTSGANRTCSAARSASSSALVATTKDDKQPSSTAAATKVRVVRVIELAG